MTKAVADVSLPLAAHTAGTVAKIEGDNANHNVTCSVCEQTYTEAHDGKDACTLCGWTKPADTTPAEQWVLVKDIADLSAGDTIVIVAAQSNWALSIEGGNNRKHDQIINTAEYFGFSDKAQRLTFGAGSADGTYSLQCINGDETGKYLYAAGGTQNNNYLKSTDTLSVTSSWKITISENGVATIVCADETVVRNILRYNSGSSCFSCYASGQADVAIYKLVTDVE